MSKTICIIDTGVLDEILRVPGKSGSLPSAGAAMLSRAESGELLVLAWPVLVEVGGHIAHCSDGSRRRQLAEAFVDLARGAHEGRAPIQAAELPTYEDLVGALDSFPDEAMRELTFADHVIKCLFDQYCERFPASRVYIWSLDQHLSGYDRSP